MNNAEKISNLNKKLEQKKNQHHFAITKVKQLDAVMEVRIRKFEMIKDLYNEQVKSFQELEAKTKPEIDKLEKEIATLEGVKEELFICPICSKEYKQKHHFDKHVEKCKVDQATIIKKQSELERLQKELEEKKAQLAKVDEKVEEIDDIIEGD